MMLLAIYPGQLATCARLGFQMDVAATSQVEDGVNQYLEVEVFVVDSI